MIMAEVKIKWETVIVKDPDSEDLMIEFSPEFLQYAGLKVGDQVHWELRESHAILTKLKDADESTDCK